MRKRHSAHERSAAVNLRLIRPICGPTHHFNVLEAVRGLTQPAHFVALSSERLLLFQECSRCEPSIVGHHRVIGRQTVISHHRGILLDVRGEVVMETCDVHHPAWPRATRDVSYFGSRAPSRTSLRGRGGVLRLLPELSWDAGAYAARFRPEHRGDGRPSKADWTSTILPLWTVGLCRRITDFLSTLTFALDRLWGLFGFSPIWTSDALKTRDISSLGWRNPMRTA